MSIRLVWTNPQSSHPLRETHYTGMEAEEAIALAAKLETDGYRVTIYGLPTVAAPVVRVKQGKRGDIPKCSLCGTEAANDDAHPMVDCLDSQLSQTKKENATLKESVSNWKNAWYQCREIIGRLAWKK